MCLQRAGDMATFTRLQQWLWVGKDKEPNASPKWGLGLKEMENVRLPSLDKGLIMGSSARNTMREWKKREDSTIDKEHDAVLVSVDESWLSSSSLLSGYESDDSDWSVGWVEPHAPHFQSDDDETSNSFAVLVPCYRHEWKEMKSRPENLFLGSINYLPAQFNESRKYVDQWLSSLQQY